MAETKAVPPPVQVVERDGALRETVAAGEDAGASLKELRWTWTSRSADAAEARRKANFDHPHRSTQAQYAEASGVSQKTISNSVTAYEIIRQGIISSRQSEEVVRLPKDRRPKVIQRVKDTGCSVRKANEEIVREEEQEAVEAVEAEVADAVDDALAEVGVSDGYFLRDEEAAIVKDKVRDLRSDYVEQQGSDAGFDTAGKALEVAQEREAFRERANTRTKKDSPDPVIGFEALLLQIEVAGKEIRGFSDELARNWDLTDEQRDQLEATWEKFSEAVEGLGMAVESKRASIVSGAEALLKGGN